MPKSAAATFDDDFGAFEPRRATAPRKPQAVRSKGQTSRGRKGRKGGGFRLDMAKVARVAAIGMGATLALGIMVNALMMQKSRHPAPLFGQTIALPKEAAAKQATVSVGAPAKPVPSALPVAQALSQPVPQQASQPTSAKAHHAAAIAGPDKPAGDDAIARLLNGGGNGAGEKTAAKGETKGDATSDGKTVLGIQRALAKLGFAIKPSGTFGPQTRKAIEAFEKDRHLPVHGEVSPRLVKLLSAESGVKLN